MKSVKSKFTQDEEITKLFNKKQIYSCITDRPVTFYDDASIPNMHEFIPTPYGDTTYLVDCKSENGHLDEIGTSGIGNTYYIDKNGKCRSFREFIDKAHQNSSYIEDLMEAIEVEFADKKDTTPVKSVARARYKGKMVPFEKETINAVQSVCHFNEYDIMIFEAYSDPQIDLILVINMLEHYLVATFTDLEDYNEAIQMAVDEIANDINKEAKLDKEKDVAALIENSDFNIKHIMIETNGDDFVPFEFDHNIPRGFDEIEARIKSVSDLSPESWARIVDLQKRLDSLYDEDMNDKTAEQIYNVLREQRRLALNCGVATFAVYPLDETDFARVVNLYEGSENTVLEHVKKCIESPVYVPVNIICDKAIDETDVPKLYELVKTILETYNDYVREVC